MTDSIIMEAKANGRECPFQPFDQVTWTEKKDCASAKFRNASHFEIVKVWPSKASPVVLWSADIKVVKGDDEKLRVPLHQLRLHARHNDPTTYIV